MPFHLDLLLGGHAASSVYDGLGTEQNIEGG